MKQLVSGLVFDSDPTRFPEIHFEESKPRMMTVPVTVTKSLQVPGPIGTVKDSD
jgi:hypothetical protein